MYTHTCIWTQVGLVIKATAHTKATFNSCFGKANFKDGVRDLNIVRSVSWIGCVARGDSLCLTENLAGVAGLSCFGNNLTCFN